MSAKCYCCIHWRGKAKYRNNPSQSPVRSECRRYPPVKTNYGSEWPVTEAFEGCGEWSENEEPIPLYLDESDNPSPPGSIVWT